MCEYCELIKDINNRKSEYVDYQARVSIIGTSYYKNERKIPKNRKGTMTYGSIIPKYCFECGEKL